MRTHVDLFSGIGGFALACQWAGVETVAFAEIDPYASRVIERRFPGVRNHGDVRNVPEFSAWLVTGGVPCQPASVAGKRRGAEDDRWLWPEALAVVERIKPTWLCLENPLGILSLEQPGLSFDLESYGHIVDAAIRGEGDSWANITGTTEFVFRDLTASIEKLGYKVQPVIIPACGLGAWHRRYRVWIMGHAASIQSRQGQQPTGPDVAGSSGTKPLPNPDGGRAHTESKRVRKREGQADFGGNGAIRSFPNPDRTGLGEQRRAKPGGTQHAAAECHSWWASEPGVGRVVDGLPARLDRLRCLGNAIVPQVANQLIKRMIQAEET